MPEFCQVERDGRLLIVTMNRPEVMNSLHPPANFELGKVFDDFVAEACRRPPAELPYRDDIYDVLLAFGPDPRLARELADHYERSALEVGPHYHGGAQPEGDA